MSSSTIESQDKAKPVAKPDTIGKLTEGLLVQV